LALFDRENMGASEAAEKVCFAQGHGFSRAASVLFLMRLQPLRESFHAESDFSAPFSPPWGMPSCDHA
jgi:hypothetical protein